jgi:4-amino-4-deoxy-L-arabinose transferase-like glycosyltransferase
MITRPSRWNVALGAVAAAALAIRLAYAFTMKNPVALQGDGWYYHNAANLLADGRGFIQPAFYLQFWGQVRQAADHPPGYIVTLGAASAVGLRSPLAHQIWSCLLGTATVVAVGLTGRAVAGRRAGLIAAVIAAVYPNFWINDGLLMSETLSMLTGAVTVLLAYLFWRRPTMPRATALGLAGALFALTRAEALLLLPVIVFAVPLLWVKDALRRRLTFATVIGVVALVALAPWVAYNRTRFQHPVLISSGLGWAMAAANCDQTYRGDFQGYWTFDCGVGTQEPRSAPASRRGDGSVSDIAFRRKASRYIGKHLDQLPSVALARLGRTFGLYKPRQQLEFDKFESGRPLTPARIGLGAFYVLAAAAIFGAVILRRRRVPILPLVALVGMVGVATVITFGQTRYRAPAEVAIVVLATVAFDAALTRTRHGRRPVAVSTAQSTNELEAAPWH